MIASARLLGPRIADMPVTGHRVGLRPTRPAIRCEVDTAIASYRLLHNYGHSGAGVSLSWGCATEIAKLAEQRLATK